MDFKVYCDLDQVLTDFSKQLEGILGYTPPKEFKDPKIWVKINKAGEEFWSEMEWLPDGRKLWDAIKKYDPTILSSPSNHPTSVAGKKVWLKKELPDVPYIIERDKYKHATPNAILIDDREKNIKKWEDAGGIGILHKNAEDTIEKLNKVIEKMETKEASVLHNPDTGRNVLKPRGEMPKQTEQVMKQERGGPYDRSKEKKNLIKELRNIEQNIEASSAHRVVLSYLKTAGPMEEITKWRQERLNNPPRNPFEPLVPQIATPPKSNFGPMPFINPFQRIKPAKTDLIKKLLSPMKDPKAIALDRALSVAQNEVRTQEQADKTKEELIALGKSVGYSMGKLIEMYLNNLEINKLIEQAGIVNPEFKYNEIGVSPTSPYQQTPVMKRWASKVIIRHASENKEVFDLLSIL